MSLISELGLDPEDVRWYHLSACHNAPLNIFYEDYEADEITAKNTDQMCLSCPVIKQCFKNGIDNKERGCWGGVYLHLGKVDKLNNDHKTEEVWETLEQVHGQRFR